MVQSLAQFFGPAITIEFVLSVSRGHRKMQSMLCAVVTMTGHFRRHCFEKTGFQNVRGSFMATFELEEGGRREKYRPLVGEEEENEMGF